MITFLQITSHFPCVKTSVTAISASLQFSYLLKRIRVLKRFDITRVALLGYWHGNSILALGPKGPRENMELSKAICLVNATRDIFVCLNLGLASPSTLYRSFWRRCFQFYRTFTRHWDRTSQALMPNETNRVYMHGWSDSHHFAWAGLDLLSGSPVLMCGRFQLCSIYFSSPRWPGPARGMW